MNRKCRIEFLPALLAAFFGLAPTVFAATPPPLEFKTPSGTTQTFSANGAIDRSNPFFQPLGNNGRSCETCHQANDGWTMTPPKIQARFNQTQGLDPVFRSNDGANSPLADVSTPQARQTAYSMLLNRGVIRVGLPVPVNAEFELAAVADPYAYAKASELSLFRRPMPTANLPFQTAVMWDGRETYAGHSLSFDLASQAGNAVLTHAQALQPATPQQLAQIVNFELSIYAAQIADNAAGRLDQLGAQGGPLPLSGQIFFPGINDPKNNNPTGAPFNPTVFNVYDPWLNVGSATPQDAAKSSIARGQALFNSRRFFLKGPGPNPQVASTCGSCHDAPNVGVLSVPAYVNTGVADAGRRTADLPLYTFRNKATGASLQTTDPGRALVTGLWADMGRFRVPSLRGLAARPPYFHDGSAPRLENVVQFYNQRFSIGLTAAEQADLVHFLSAL